MPARLHRNGQTFHLGQGAVPGPQQASLRFRSQADARSFLCGFMGDPFAMAQLRSLLASEAPVHRLNDHKVIDILAGRLVSGSLSVSTRGQAVRWSGGGGGQGSGSSSISSSSASSNGSASPPPSAQEPAEPVATPPPAATPTPAEQEPRDEENVDAAVQAATLKEAARSGVPFCEQCEKARRERESRALAA